MEAITDPGAVINSLQARITQMEAQLRVQQTAHESEQGQYLKDSLRRLRLHGIIPLYVGGEGVEALVQQVAKSSPQLTESLSEIWLLATAPVPQAVRDALSSAANNGMSRWN